MDCRSKLNSYTSSEEDTGDQVNRETGEEEERDDDKCPHLREETCESDPHMNRVSVIYPVVAGFCRRG